MKQMTLFTAISISLILTACGGGTETKKTENEQKTPPAALATTNPANVQNTPKIETEKKDADDLPVNKPAGNSNSNISKPSKKDADDLNKKKDADDKNRNKSSVRDGDDDDN